MTGAGLLILYIRTRQAAWLYTWLTYGAAFAGGTLALAIAIAILAALRARRQRREALAIEEARNLRFSSDELGYIDFFANKEKAEAQLAKAIIPISKEIEGLGKTTTKQVRKLKPNTTFTRRQEIATETATIFNEHSERIEKRWKIFAELDDILAESNVGCVNWLNPADESHKLLLAQQRSASVNFLASLDGALPSMESFRNTVAAQRGASQNLNTAIARLTFVLDGLIGALRKSQSRWQHLITLIDRRPSP